MVQWIVENFGTIGHIADGKGNLPIHFDFAAAGGRLPTLSLSHAPSLSHPSLPLSPFSLLPASLPQSLTRFLTHPFIQSFTYLCSGSISIIKYFVQQYGKEYAEKRDKSQTAPSLLCCSRWSVLQPSLLFLILGKFCVVGKIDVLKYLVDGVGVDPVAKDLSGMSTIHAASMGHQLEVVKVRLTHSLTTKFTNSLSLSHTHTLTHSHTHTHALKLRMGEMSKSQSLGNTGWHVDGHQGAERLQMDGTKMPIDRVYCMSNVLPTQLTDLRLDLNPVCQKAHSKLMTLDQFNLQDIIQKTVEKAEADAQEHGETIITTAGENCLFYANPYVLHQSPVNNSDKIVRRSFVRLLYTVDERDRIGDTVSPVIGPCYPFKIKTITDILQLPSDIQVSYQTDVTKYPVL